MSKVRSKGSRRKSHAIGGIVRSFYHPAAVADNRRRNGGTAISSHGCGTEQDAAAYKARRLTEARKEAE